MDFLAIQPFAKRTIKGELPIDEVTAPAGVVGSMPAAAFGHTMNHSLEQLPDHRTGKQGHSPKLVVGERLHRIDIEGRGQDIQLEGDIPLTDVADRLGT